MRDILLIVGNGLSIDLHKNYLKKLDPCKPMDWEFKINQDPAQISWQDAFPKLHAYFKKNIGLLNGDHFKVFEEIKSKENYAIQTEARHFLALAYTHFTMEMYIPRIWKWSKFIRLINSKIHSVISFNYDSCIEETIITGGKIRYYSEKCTLNSYADDRINIFKPHGCRTMEIDSGAINMGQVRYPLVNWVGDNNSPIIVLPPHLQNRPRTQSFCILPYEKNHYEKHQWQDKIWATMDAKYQQIKNCIIIGHSYGDVDRGEIDNILNALPRDVTVHLCDPNPSIDLQKMLAVKNISYKLYTDKEKTPNAKDFL